MFLFIIGVIILLIHIALAQHLNEFYKIKYGKTTFLSWLPVFNIYILGDVLFDFFGGIVSLLIYIAPILYTVYSYNNLIDHCNGMFELLCQLNIFLKSSIFLLFDGIFFLILFYCSMSKYDKLTTMNLKQYVKVVDGTKSNAGGFEYKINEVNVADKWNPNATDPSEMGGFNFSVEDKVLRWLLRGDTLYDVEIPMDAEIVEVEHKNCPHGVFRSNKIIIKNPRPITEDLVIELYNKSNLPERTYYQCLVNLLYRNHKEAVKYIINDRINKDNVKDAILEFENYSTKEGVKFNYNNLWDDAKEIYDMLKEIANK